MDAHYFGSNLLKLDRIAAGGRRPFTQAEEGAYYAEHMPVERRNSPRIGLALTGVAIGFAIIGLWQS